MAKKKYYNSMQEFHDEFTKNFNKSVPEKIMVLWDSIIKYARAAEELGAEGNSRYLGDFYEQEKLEKALENREKEVAKNFAGVTGYEPFFVLNKDSVIYLESHSEFYNGAWDFKEIKKEPKPESKPWSQYRKD